MRVTLASLTFFPVQSSSKIADLAFLIAAFVLPAYFVFRARRPDRAALIAIPTFWGMILIAGWVLSGLDPERKEANAMLDGFWILLGWVPATIYALLLYWTKRLFLFAQSRLR